MIADPTDEGASQNPRITRNSQVVDASFTPPRESAPSLAAMAVTNAPHGQGALAEPAAGTQSDPLAGRFGVTVPHEWWPSAPLLKSYEAAGFDWVQVDAPPASVLADRHHRGVHANALGEALLPTGLRAVIHAPSGLRVGRPGGAPAFAGLLEYAGLAGAAIVVYHALGVPDEAGAESELSREAEALRRLAVRAEELGVLIALENLAPLYPGQEAISANPLSLRGAVLRASSDAVGVCIDVGHAHIVAERRHTSLAQFVEPVLDLAILFHAHDNYGARDGRHRRAAGVDPLRLDLHLPPGRGTLPWHELRPAIAGHDAPVVIEAHPPYRPRPTELRRTAAEAIAG